jgi:hypothetical protein
MSYAEIATLRFGSNDEAVAIVRAGPHEVLLALSLQSNGDVEVSLTTAEAKDLVECLRSAIANAENGP